MDHRAVYLPLMLTLEMGSSTSQVEPNLQSLDSNILQVLCKYKLLESKQDHFKRFVGRFFK